MGKHRIFPRKLQKKLLNDYKHIWNAIFTTWPEHWTIIKAYEILLYLCSLITSSSSISNFSRRVSKIKRKRTVWEDRWLSWRQNPFDFYHTGRWKAWLIVGQPMRQFKKKSYLAKYVLTRYGYLTIAWLKCFLWNYHFASDLLNMPVWISSNQHKTVSSIKFTT